MAAEGKYVYCIIGSGQERSFGPIGMGGRGDEVATLGGGGLCMVVSDSPVAGYAVSREHLLAHQKVVEEVMREFTVLPVSFSTIAASADCIRNVLEKREREFKGLLKAMEHKVEMGVKAVWKDMDAIFKEIVEENEEIKRFREAVVAGDRKSTPARLEIGRLIGLALAGKKEREAEAVMAPLITSAFDYRAGRTTDDRMFLNASFLVSGGREKEFDNTLAYLGDYYRERTVFKYVGPLPPFNFANVTIHPEEWE